MSPIAEAGIWGLRRTWMAFLIGFCAATFAGGTVEAGNGDRRTPVVLAIQKVQPSVVSISSEKRAASNARWPFTTEESQRPRISGMGTGVIIDQRGYILTNQHVVDRVHGV